MKLHALRDLPPAHLANLLADFERQFVYPLGNERSFRISHGDDYARFYRAMGDAVSLILEKDGRAVGSLGVAARQLLLPSGRQQTVAYLGDLKIEPASRHGFALYQLARAAREWLGDRTAAAFGIVMDGTRATPDAYTGRLGFPRFDVVGKTMVWQLPCASTRLSDEMERLQNSTEHVDACYRRLSQGRYACPCGDPRVRSEMIPVALVHPEGLACGVVEDTRRCKRLIADDGAELRSGHLSFFAFQSPAAGAEVLRAALVHAARAGHPALFVVLAPDDPAALDAALGPMEKTLAPATIFGVGFESSGHAWNVNSSEI